MVEQKYHLSTEPTVEKIILDENLHYLHMILSQGEALPEHRTNSTVYMTVVRGTLTLRLEDEPARDHAQGSVLKIPFQARMLVRNTQPEPLELIVIKAPAPAR